MKDKIGEVEAARDAIAAEREQEQTLHGRTQMALKSAEKSNQEVARFLTPRFLGVRGVVQLEAQLKAPFVTGASFPTSRLIAANPTSYWLSRP